MNKNTDYIINGGRSIHITVIDQWGTYEGLLEGIPTMEMNVNIIKDTINRATVRYNITPYLIKPTETPIVLDRAYPFGTPASLPAIACVSLFHCRSVAKDKSMDASMLTVVWFQDDFAFPIQSNILNEIPLIDWERNAFDYQY